MEKGPARSFCAEIHKMMSCGIPCSICPCPTQHLCAVVHGNLLIVSSHKLHMVTLFLFRRNADQSKMIWNHLIALITPSKIIGHILTEYSSFFFFKTCFNLCLSHDNVIISVRFSWASFACTFGLLLFYAFFDSSMKYSFVQPYFINRLQVRYFRHVARFLSSSILQTI